MIKRKRYGEESPKASAASSTSTEADRMSRANSATLMRLPPGKACFQCKQRKQRCDSMTPKCTACRKGDRLCVYNRENMPSFLLEHISNLEARLKQIERSNHATDANPDAITHHRRSGSSNQETTGIPLEQQQFLNSGPIRHANAAFDWEDPEANIMREGEPMGATIENENSSRMGGYFGDSSNFSFFKSVDKPLNKFSDCGPSKPFLSAESPRHSQLLALDDDIFNLPARQFSDMLVLTFFRNVNSLNPHVNEKEFMENYEETWTGNLSLSKNLPWLTLLNLVWGLGCEFSDLPAEQISKPASNYMRRAKLLIFSDLAVVGNLQSVQALLLLGQYFQNLLELNQCWIITGLAIRTAQGIGLHLDPSSWNINSVEKETRKRVWWSCYIIDRAVSMMAGRPPIIRDDDNITIGLPLDVDERHLTQRIDTTHGNDYSGDVTAVQFLHAIVGLSRITESILTTIYQVKGSTYGHTSGEQRDTNLFPRTELSTVVSLDEKLQQWKDSLPIILLSETTFRSWHDERYRKILSARAANVRILLHRNTFVRFAKDELSDETNNKFGSALLVASALECILAAEQLFEAVRYLHEGKMLGPWKLDLHYLLIGLGVLVVGSKLSPEKKKRLAKEGMQISYTEELHWGLEALQSFSHLSPLVRTWTNSLLESLNEKPRNSVSLESLLQNPDQNQQMSLSDSLNLNTSDLQLHEEAFWPQLAVEDMLLINSEFLC